MIWEEIMTLLIVNDEELTADTMRDTIDWKRYGIDDVFVAYQAEDARKILLAEQIDILLCDIEMPGENGLSLLKWVRTTEMPVECLFLTCHASFDYAKQAIGLNCKEYILLPAKYEDIGRSVGKAAERIMRSREEHRLQEYGEFALQQLTEQQQGQEPVTLVRRVKQDILKNLGEETLSVASVAERHYIHPVYMNRVFKRETGISVSQYIMNERMYVAKHLLESGACSANHVAAKIGYRNYSNFSAAFKRFYGESPSRIMQSAQDGGGHKV